MILVCRCAVNKPTNTNMLSWSSIRLEKTLYDILSQIFAHQAWPGLVLWLKEFIFYLKMVVSFANFPQKGREHGGDTISTALDGTNASDATACISLDAVMYTLISYEYSVYLM